MPSKRVLLAALVTLCLAAIAQPAFAQYTENGSALAGNPLMANRGQPGLTSNLPGPSKNPHKTVDKVKRDLQNANPDVRVEALKKLRYIRIPQANKVLISALSDPDMRVRIKAIDLLGARGANAAVAPLSQMLFLRTTESLVKLHVVAALGRIGDSQGALPVIEYLEQERAQGDNPQACGTAVFALGEIGSPKATPLLTRIFATDKNEMVRQLAKEALEKIDGELPSQHSMRVAEEQDKKSMPTDERLAKLRKFDKKLEAMDR